MSEKPAPAPSSLLSAPALTPIPLPDDLSELLPAGEPVQLLDTEGVRHAVVGYEAPIDADRLLGLYRDLVLARRVDTQALNLSRQGRLGAYPTALGQEAVEVGAARALAEQDWLFPTYRETMAVVVRGVDPLDVLRANQAASFLRPRLRGPSHRDADGAARHAGRARDGLRDGGPDAQRPIGGAHVPR